MVKSISTDLFAGGCCHYLFETNDDPDFQIALIEEAMGNFHRYFFIMPTLARFEAEMYERLERGEPA